MTEHEHEWTYERVYLARRDEFGRVILGTVVSGGWQRVCVRCEQTEPIS